MQSHFFRKLAYDANIEVEEMEHAMDAMMMFLYMLVIFIAVLYMCLRG